MKKISFKFIYKNFFCLKNVLLTGFIIILFFSAFTILKSDLNSHPDELEHYHSALYYKNNFIPPKICSNKTKKTYSIYGTSRLDNLGIEYFLAGKMAFFGKYFGLENITSIRSFSFLLLFILFLLFLHEYKLSSNYIILFTPIFITPQIWYLFSYFNDDIFPFFLTFILFFQTLKKGSLVNKYLFSKNLLPKEKKSFFGFLLLILLISLILISKINYLISLLNFVIFIIWKIFFLKQKKSFYFKKIIIVLSCCFLIFLSRLGIDFIINKSINRKETINACKEIRSIEAYKPSTLKNNPDKTDPDFRLKAKGFKPKDIFLYKEKSFLISNLKSFFGLYGYMLISAPNPYYYFITITNLSLLFIFFHNVLKEKKFRNFLLIFIILLTFFISFLATFINSWIIDFQPQGRYLFPIISVLMILIKYGWKKKDKKRITFLMILIICLGVYSFSSAALIFDWHHLFFVPSS